MPCVPSPGLVVNHTVDESLPPPHLGGVAVSVVHLLNVTDATGRHAHSPVSVSGNVCIRFVNVSVETASPVSMVQFSWTYVRRAEPVNELGTTFR